MEQAYCMKCKERVDIAGDIERRKCGRATFIFGKCSKCDTKVSTIAPKKKRK